MSKMPFSRRQAVLLARNVASAALATALFGRGAHAQVGMIRMVVPMAAGGPADFVARLLAERLGQKLSANMVVDNRPGANGAIGGTAVATAAPDGATLLLATSGLFTIAPTLETKGTFNSAEMTPISSVVVNGTALIVHASHPANSIADLVAMAKAGKKPVTLGSAGFGNILHLYVELLNVVTKAGFLHVPYRGVALAMNDAVARNIDGLFADLPAALPQIAGGTMKALGLVGETRSPAAPHIPTIAEQGFPGVNGASWFGLFGPPKMAPDLAETLATKVGEVLREPELVAKLQAVGSQPTPTTPAEFAQRIKRDREHWARLIKERNVRLEK